MCARRQFDRTGKGGSMEVTTRLTPQPGPHPQRPHDGRASIVHLYGDYIPLTKTQRALEPQARLHGDLGHRAARDKEHEQAPEAQPVHAPSEADDTRRAYLAM